MNMNDHFKCFNHKPKVNKKTNKQILNQNNEKPFYQKRLWDETKQPKLTREQTNEEIILNETKKNKTKITY